MANELEVVSRVLNGISRKKDTQRIFLNNGEVVEVAVLDGLLIDDVLDHAMKAEAFRVRVGEDRSFVINRTIKDYLIKIGLVLE